MVAETLFWLAFASAFYAYFGYPLLLLMLPRRRWREDDAAPLPSVTLIIPAHNEEAVIGAKLDNTLALDYPRDRLEILLVSDGSTDRTVEIAKARAGVTVIELHERRGKAHALNHALAKAGGDIVVFSDASIQLEPQALVNIVRPFADPSIGCVSGEDRIEGGGGEGAYGRYELYLRKLESRTASIVGASGCFYAQRRELCTPFAEGMAPDFLSVLNTVEAGFRAISEPRAVGYMRSVKSPRAEFARKVRTFLRGMSALSLKRHLLNPLRYGRFAVILASHKLVRWLVPVFLAAMLMASAVALDQPFYAFMFWLQVAFYLSALGAYFGVAGMNRITPARISLYFTSVNIAIVYAWIDFAKGVRQEVWDPSRRTN